MSENYSECPACHHWQQDEDGFGVLYCETCGYCTHASVDGTTCGLCKREVVTRMSRSLRYVLVEWGVCHHCLSDAGKHSIEGLCAPGSDERSTAPDAQRTQFRGMQGYAFVDMESGEVRAALRRIESVA